MKTVQRMGAAALASVILALFGCQPEGVGTVKAPTSGPRGNDDRLGRPFGNAPELPKKAAPAKAPNEGIQPKNERL
jgi:hypothetical protein